MTRNKKNRTERPRSTPPEQPAPASAAATDEASASKEKKERVLHTRIPAVLEQELKRFANSLRVPVSNVVRTILQDALQVADRAGGLVEEELREAARRVSSERHQIRERLRRADPTRDVIGYQPLVLARDESCDRCGVKMASGADAWLGLMRRAGDQRILCEKCVAGAASG